MTHPLLQPITFRNEAEWLQFENEGIRPAPNQRPAKRSWWQRLRARSIQGKE